MSSQAETAVTECPQCSHRFRVARDWVGKRANCPCGARFTVEAADGGAPAGARPASDGAPASAPTDSALDGALSPPGQAVATASAAPDEPIIPLMAERATCRRHPDAAATAACAQCRRLICATCDFQLPDGRHLCPDCAVQGTAASDNPFASPTALPFAAGNCRRHPDVPAVARCTSCGAPTCATCDFQFPGRLHYCPSCATNPSPKLTGGRKGVAIWSLVAAGWVSFMLLLSIMGVMAEMVHDEAGAMVVGSLIMIPGLLGIALALGSLDRRAGNPPLVWIAVIWNIVTAAACLLLMIVGMMASM
jgi:hypothetical protein